jgi:hypothetical protein
MEVAKRCPRGVDEVIRGASHLQHLKTERQAI